MNKPNHICKICRKEYYFCDYCGQETSFAPYKSVCCSIECYQKYVDEILTARGELEPITVHKLEAKVEDIPETEIDETIESKYETVKKTKKK